LPSSASPKLRGQFAKHGETVQSPATDVQLVFHQFRKGEALQEGHNVREAFVERCHIRISILHVTVMDGIQDRMCHFMGHDIRAQTGEDQPSRVVGSLRLLGGGEVAEEQRLLV